MQHSLFGTDGIRTTVGKDPLTLKQLPRLGNAIAQWTLATSGKSNPRILIAHDTRLSCSLIKAALKVGLLAHSLHIHDAHILPTPALCKIMQQNLEFDCGLMISASHNPYQDNGIKIIASGGKKISTHDELLITEFFSTTPCNDTIHYDACGIDIPFVDAHRSYLQALRSYSTHTMCQGITIVLDCAHGATSSLAPTIFEQLGARVITINSSPDGKNINQHCGSLYPEIIQKAVLALKADIGFAFDGDGDRVIAADAHGSLLDGDDILALLLAHPLYAAQDTVVGTIMSNEGFRQHLEKIDKSLLRVPVGDTHVLRTLEENNLLLGGEPSGHIIMRDYLSAADGIFTAIRIVETLLHHGSWHIDSFNRLPQVIINVPTHTKPSLQSTPIAQVIAQHEALLKNGRLVVRYSGTQNVLRIMTEDIDKESATHVAESLARTLKPQLL
jgi:phosphoglucosamine mutase